MNIPILLILLRPADLDFGFTMHTTSMTFVFANTQQIQRRMRSMRKKTNQVVLYQIGPFIDDADGKSAETGLTITAAEVRVSKNGANIIAKNEANACTHDEIGVYGCPVDTTDTNTLGRLQIWVHESGALPVWHEYMVVTANVYNSFSGSGNDYLKVDVEQIDGGSQSATDLKDFADAGYDPATHYTLGVTTCTTTTTNTDMRGTDSAALAATALTDATWTDAKAAFIDHSISTVDGVCDTIAVDVAGINGEAMRGTDSAALATGVDVTSIHGSALTETVGGYLAAGFTKLFDVSAPVLVASDVMRGTDGANTTVPDAAGVAPTVGEIRTEMEGAGTKLTLTLEDTADLQGNQAAWATATTVALNAQGKLDVNAEVDTALADIKLDHLIHIAVDTNWATTVHLDSVIGHIADVGTAATFSRTTDALEAIRDRGDGEWVTATTAALSAQGKLDVNAEVVDVIRTDVTAEMAQAAPPATPTFEEMIAYIYFSLRNKTETTASENAVYNNAGDTKLFKAAISDNGTTFAKAEYVSGV
jgi:hypothetical protein